MKTRCLQTLFIILLLQSVVVLAEDAKTGPEGPRYDSVEERRLLLTLQQERNSLAEERKKLDEKQKELKRLEIEVDKKLEQLSALRKRIENLIAEKDKEEARKIRELSKMYEKMSAAQAARIMSALDQDLAISILENMKTKSAAKILDNMDKDKAAGLTDAFSNLDIR